MRRCQFVLGDHQCEHEAEFQLCFGEADDFVLCQPHARSQIERSRGKLAIAVRALPIIPASSQELNGSSTKCAQTTLAGGSQSIVLTWRGSPSQRRRIRLEHELHCLATGTQPSLNAYLWWRVGLQPALPKRHRGRRPQPCPANPARLEADA